MPETTSSGILKCLSLTGAPIVRARGRSVPGIAVHRSVVDGVQLRAWSFQRVVCLSEETAGPMSVELRNSLSLRCCRRVGAADHDSHVAYLSAQTRASEPTEQ
jgi:hypothetical protein